MEAAYKIIKIIDENRVVINGGDSQGVSRDDELEVFVEGEEVIDPETEESLGRLDLIKGRLRVTEVLPNMSICVNAETVATGIGAITNAHFSHKPKSLNIDSTQISGFAGDKDIQDYKIRIGDAVREALG